MKVMIFLDLDNFRQSLFLNIAKLKEEELNKFSRYKNETFY